MIKLTTPFDEEKALSLKAGDSVLLSGIIYTGRDAAHKRLVEMVKRNLVLPRSASGKTAEVPGCIA